MTPDSRRQPLRAGHEELAGLPHLAHQEQRRQRVPVRPRGGPGQPGRASRAPRRTSTSCGLTGIFSRHPRRRSGDVPASAMQGYASAGGAVNDYTASNQPMWDISNTTTWVTGNHTINFGANYRRWWLQRDTGRRPSRATSGTSTSASPATRSRTSCSATTAAPRAFQPGPFAVAGRGGQPLRVQLDVLRPLHPGRLEGQLQAHPEPRPPLRLPQRALRDERPHGLAEPRLCAGRPPRGGPEPGDAGSSTAPTTRRPGDAAPRTPTATRSSLPGISFAYRPTASGEHGHPGRLRDLLRLRRGTRDRRRRGRLSVRQPRTTTPRPSARRRRSRRRTSCSRASRAAAWRTPAANSFLAVSQSPEPRNPKVQQWSLGVQRQLSGSRPPRS